MMVPRNGKVASMLCKVSPVVFIPDIGTWYLVPGTWYLVPGMHYVRVCTRYIYALLYVDVLTFFCIDGDDERWYVAKNMAIYSSSSHTILLLWWC